MSANHFYKVSERTSAENRPKALSKLKFMTNENILRKHVNIPRDDVKTSRELRARTDCGMDKQKIYEKALQTRGQVILEPREIRAPKLQEKSAPLVYSSLGRLEKRDQLAAGHARAMRSMRLPRDTRFDL